MQLSHRDGRGHLHRPSKRALAAVLEALGAPPERDGGENLPPVIVAWEGSTELPRSDENATWVLRLEDGSERRWTTRRGDRLDVGRLPYGYHDLEGPSGEVTRIIAAPRRAPPPQQRSWGVFLPLYALHSERSTGIGDVTDLEALLRWTSKHGGSFVGTLPLYATFGDDPSPYAPSSRLFLNEVYADPQRTPEYEHARAARDIVSSDAYANEVQALRREPLVDHARVHRLKRRVLEGLADVADVARMNAFADAEPLARDYAVFRARLDARGDGPERARGERYHLYAQLVANEQLGAVASAESGAGLYLDLPLGVHPDGFDVHRFPDVFARGVSVGAPPDALAADGQDWGFPPLHPHATRAKGHAYFAAVIGKAMRAATALRIDHVLGLHRQYWIPEGMPPHEGVYVRYPSEELYAVLTLEAHRTETIVVGEDLGTLPREVRPAMRRHGIASTYVFQFEASPGEIRPPARDVLACVNTHDTETFAAFWEGLGAERRRVLAASVGTDADAGPTEVVRSVAAFLAAGPARLVQVSLEDLWGEVQPQNIPGTTSDERPNWRRKAGLSLEQMTDNPAVVDTLAELARLRPTGRVR